MVVVFVVPHLQGGSSGGRLLWEMNLVKGVVGSSEERGTFPVILQTQVQ